MQLSSPSVKMREVLLFFVINFKYLKYPVLHVAFLRIHSLFCHIVQLLLHSRHKIRIRGLFKVAGANQAVEIFHTGIDIVVDYDIVIGIHSVGLLRGTAETFFDHFRALSSAAGKTFFQVLRSRRYASGNFFLILSAPWISISRITSFPAAIFSSTYFFGVP